MRRRSQYAFLFALILVLTAAAAGTGWAVDNPYISTVYCAEWPYQNQLTAVVTDNLDGTYHYEYTLEFLQTSFELPLTDFSIGNPDGLAYTNPGFTYANAFSMGDHADSVYWYIDWDAVTVGQTVKFWFDSVYSYTERDVTVVAGLNSVGTTLGMVIPEPAGFAALALGLIGVLPIVRRRR